MSEMPYPEFETHWERPQADPCPNCRCCSARLCARAAMDGKLCLEAAAPEDYRIVVNCPCQGTRPPLVSSWCELRLCDEPGCDEPGCECECHDDAGPLSDRGGVRAMTAEEFEALYANRSDVTVEWLHRHGRYAEPCDCGTPDCTGWAIGHPWEDAIIEDQLRATRGKP